MSLDFKMILSEFETRSEQVDALKGCESIMKQYNDDDVKISTEKAIKIYKKRKNKEKLNIKVEEKKVDTGRSQRKSKSDPVMEAFLGNGNPHVRTAFIEAFNDDSGKTKYLLNVECTQFTIGKTNKALDHIDLTNYAKIHELNVNNNDSDCKIITIIVSRCSLAETLQWKVRTEGRFGKTLNICTVSSKTKKDKLGNGYDIKNFITSLTSLDDKNLPDILLMCAHSVRVKKDIIELLKSQKRIIHTNGTKFKFNIMFDEADANIELICQALKMIRETKDEDTGKTCDQSVNEVHFITATPGPSFWKSLAKIGIRELDNFDFVFGKDITPEERQKAVENYQSVLTQSFTPHTGNEPALDQIKDVMENTNLIPNINNNRNIIFAPGEREVKTHYAIKEYFSRKGYFVFMHNGQKKGIFDPSGEFLSLEQINDMYNLENPELRDTLVAWAANNPSASLAIVGWFTITRGLTFNTTGFNFTHMIFSWCHAKKLNEFVQLLGRCCGNKKYCGNIQIIGPKEAFEKAQEFVRGILSIKQENVSKFDRKSFELNKKLEETHFEVCMDKFKARDFVREHLGPRTNPFKYGCKNENIPQPDSDGFYHHTLRKENGILSKKFVLANRGWGLNIKTSKYRIHPCYEDVTDANTCKWIVCIKKENLKKPEDKPEKKVSVMDAFGK